MRYFYWLLLLCSMLFYQTLSADIKTVSGKYYKATGIPHLDTAISYIGVRETGNNSGKQVSVFQKVTGTGAGANWCASFVSYCLDKGKVTWFKIRSALAQAFITKKSIRASRVLLGIETVPRGALAIWKHGNTWRGHIGIVYSWLKGAGMIVEGNTANAVKMMYRRIIPNEYFRIVYFTVI